VTTAYPTPYRHRSEDRVFIYALRDDRKNDIRYIGKTSRSLQWRLDRHRWAAKSGTTWVHNWVRSTNDQVSIILIEEVARANADAAEVKWIAEYRARGCRLTNISSGGESGHTFSLTPEQRSKISAANHRRFADPAAREHMARKGRERPPMPGRPQTDEHKAKLSRINSRPKTEAEKAAMKAAALRRIADPIARAALIARLQAARRPMSDETRAKISAAGKGRKKSESMRSKLKANWQKLSKEERRERLFNFINRKRQPMSDEDRQRIGAATKARWQSLSPEQKADRLARLNGATA